MQQPSGVCSVKDAAKIAGVTVQRICQLLSEKKIDGMKLNPRAWLVSKSSAEKYASEEHPVGRPREKRKGGSRKK